MTVKKGDNIKVEYEGSFDNGEVFDSSTHGDHSHPLEFEVGTGQVIRGFDEAVIGMNLNGEKKIHITQDQAYGPRREELKQKIDRGKLPSEPEPKVGMMLAVRAPDGNQFPAMIMEVNENEVVIDLNHPLAGKNLNFKIKIIGIN